MKEQLIDLILEYANTIYYAPAQEASILRQALYAQAEQLYARDPASFEQIAFSLLAEHVPELETESAKIRMECAQIWHKNGFDVWLFRILYALGISPDTTTTILKQKIKVAFSSQGGDAMVQSDVRRGYERLFRQALQSDAPQDHSLRIALEQILTPDLAEDVEGIIAYISICGKSKNTLAYMKHIYTAITTFSLIECDGLHGYLTENTPSALRTFATALKRLGLVDASEIVKAFYEKCQKTAIADSLCITEAEAAEQQLMLCLNSNTLMEAANNFLNHKS